MSSSGAEPDPGSNPVRSSDPVAAEDRDFGDPSRRTYFAEERTLLAWWRSSLAAIAVALGVGRLVPALTNGPKGPYVALGVGYAVLAIVFILYGPIRQRMVDRALAAGRFEPLDARVMFVLTMLLVVLAFATMITLLVGA
jgi:putative membrane protein